VFHGRVLPFEYCPSQHKHQDKTYDENEKQYFGDTFCTFGNTTETKDGGDYRNDKEYGGPA